MKSEGSIRQKLKQARFRHLKKILKDSLKKKPANCGWNRTLELPTGGQVSFCALYAEDPGSWQGLICDEQYDGLELARQCPVYEAKYDKETLKDDFKQLMAEGPIGMIAASYPDIAALMWVLGDEETIDLQGFSYQEGEEEPAENEGEEDPDEEQGTFEVVAVGSPNPVSDPESTPGFWRRLWRRWTGRED